MDKKRKIPKEISKKKYVLGENRTIGDMRSMLDKNPDEEMTDVSDDKSADEKAARRFNRRFYFIVGIIVIILSMIGLVSVISFTAGKISDVVNNTGQKNEFSHIVYPLVICDPAPFDDVSKLNGDTVVTAACWQIILGGDTDRYTKDFDYITVPAADIEQAAAELFGEGLTIEHTSIINSDIQFYYSAEKDSYRIPYDPKYFSYSPTVEEISKSGSTYTVEVGYISPTPTWFSANETKPEKYMIYTLEKNSDGYIISSVKLSEKHVNTDSGL